MICSPASGVESLLGGLSHPEMFYKSVGGNDNFRHTRFRKKTSFCIVISILCHLPGHPTRKEKNAEKKILNKINCFSKFTISKGRVFA